jgi:hypothetical protein
LSIRLWAPTQNDPSGEVLGKNSTPAVSVAVDLVEASGGTRVVEDGNLLVSSFSSLQSAILVARRIQWAVSACSEVERGSAAILIQSAEEHSSQRASTASALRLDDASPGQILLAEATCQSLENLPGLPLLLLSSGLRELQWRTSEEISSRVEDERILDRLMQQHGVEVPEPVRPEATSALPPAPAPELPAVAERDFVAPVRVGQPGEPPDGGWLSRVREMPLWLKGVLGAVPLAIVVALFLVLFPSKAPEHAPGQPAPVLPSGQQKLKATSPADTSAGSQPPSAKTEEPQKHIQAPKTQARAKSGDPAPKPRPAPAEPKQNGSCNFSASEIPSELRIADARFQNRQYGEAEKKYRSVLACDSENAHARSGAERAHSALQLQPSSNNP